MNPDKYGICIFTQQLVYWLFRFKWITYFANNFQVPSLNNFYAVLFYPFDYIKSSKRNTNWIGSQWILVHYFFFLLLIVLEKFPLTNFKNFFNSFMLTVFNVKTLPKNFAHAKITFDHLFNYCSGLTSDKISF